MTERPEIARIKVCLNSSTDIEAVRQVVRCAKICKRVVEATFDGSHIIFHANIRREKPRPKGKR